MLRGVVILAGLAVLALGAAWLADHPGRVVLDWQGWRIETSIGVVVLGVALLNLTFLIIFRLWSFIAATPMRWRRARDARRRERGQNALARGLLAVATGDGAAAAKEARIVSENLGHRVLTLLLEGEAARVSGDHATARRLYGEMLETPETRLLGYRGLALEAYRAGDLNAALDHVSQAARAQPRASWALELLFDVQLRTARWAEAEETLDRLLRARLVTPEIGKRRRALLRLEQSRAAETNGLEDAALDHARAAERLDETLLAAVLRTADLLARRGRTQRAARVLERAWERAPHRLIGEAYAGLYADDTPLNRVIKIEKLRQLQPDHAETHLILGEAALKAGLWGEARTHLKAAAEGAPSRRVFRALAELAEMGDNDGAAVRQYLARAADAPADPVWSCTNCGKEVREVTAVCPDCGAFDTIRFGPPAPHHAPRLAGSQVLDAPALPAAGSTPAAGATGAA